MIKNIFSKKALTLAAVGSAVGVGAHYIDNYIQSNSGCFIKSGSSVCKVKEFSCCQKDPVANVPFCTDPLHVNTCKDYDEDTEKSCCRLCDCKYYGCLPHQVMECRRPDVGEALAYYAGKAANTFWDIIKIIFPWLYWLLGILAIGIACIVAWYIYQKTR